MRKLHKVLLCSTMLMSGVALNAYTPPIFMSPALAQQRVEIRADFRTALEPYGRFERHPRFGEVWRPARLAKDWRPYTIGRWVYTDDWGWYWNAAETEENWGWVAYHYGRWYNDDRMGWVWIAGDEWAPAWVNWRRGDARGRDRQSARYVGWAPLPPDEVITEVRDDPDFWIFVRAQDMVAPRISTVVVRAQERQRLIRETVIVNRTYVVRDRGPLVIVNPGIEPAFVAAVIGRPIRAYDVRPRVFVGTANISGAIEVRGKDLRDRRRFESQRVQVRETQTEIRPAQNITAPRPLEANEQGRLGERPPRAAATDQQRREGERRPDQRPERTGEKPAEPAPGDKPAATTQERREGETDRQQQGRDATQKPGEKPTATTQERKSEPDRKQQGRDATEKPGEKPAAAAQERKSEPDRKQQGRDATEKPGDKPAAAAQERKSEPERRQQGRDATEKPAAAKQERSSEPERGRPEQARGQRGQDQRGQDQRGQDQRGEDQRSATGANPPRRENPPGAERRQQKPEGDEQPGRGRGRERERGAE